MSSHILVLDANILIRAVLGKKVRNYLIEFAESVDFFVPDICFDEAKKYLPILFEKKGLMSEIPLEVLANLKNFLKVIDEGIYQERAVEAQQRMQNRDIHDWPAVATALLFNCPIWTEDKDFFGVGDLYGHRTVSIFFLKCAFRNI